MATNPSVFIDVVGSIRFLSARSDQTRLVGLQPEKNVGVIRHTVYRDQFLFTLRYNAGDVLLQFFFTLATNDTGAP